MRKQTIQRQYGYVSPKCKTIRLDAGFCQVGSPGGLSYDGVDNGHIGGLGGINYGDDI